MDTTSPESLVNLPETEKLTVELKTDVQGLGITIVGYVCEKGRFSQWYRYTVYTLGVLYENG